MALQDKDLLTLMLTVARTKKEDSDSNKIVYSYNGKNYTYKSLNDTLREELQELAGTYSLYRENKNKIFSLIEQTITDILPRKVMEEYNQFAETRTIEQGNTYIFKHKTGRMRAKQFITRVGLAGRYEVFKLGEENFEVKTSAIGGAIQIAFEEFLDGRVDWAELTQILMEGMDELIYREIAQALMASINQLPTANIGQAAGFDEAIFDRLIATASAYGQPTIYCTYEFAVKMMPSADWVSNAMKDERWANGYFTRYKATPVVILPQSFEDETNATKVIDPGYVWIIPSGGNDKPVKVVFEGTSHIKEHDNDDWSRDMQVYMKVGVGVLMTNNICSYVDTSLKGKLTNV